MTSKCVTCQNIEAIPVPENIMANESDPWKKTFYDRAIQTHIGRGLRTHYELPQRMSDRLAELVREIEGDREVAGYGGAKRQPALDPADGEPGRRPPLKT
jgi:hypothetical protein